jgi:hypothetical protein
LVVIPKEKDEGRGGLAVLLSRPCDRKKSQRRGTEAFLVKPVGLWYPGSGRVF